jgi:hypothetical protein
MLIRRHSGLNRQNPMTDWQPCILCQKTKSSVVDDIINYRTYRVLGTIPDRTRASAVRMIYNDACALSDDCNEMLVTRAKYRQTWAVAWLLECDEWIYTDYCI